MILIRFGVGSLLILAGLVFALSSPPEIQVSEDAEQLNIHTTALEAAVRKTGYVSGVYRGTFLDKKTGFRDPGFGLDIADFILEPGSDDAYRDQVEERLRYKKDKMIHGDRVIRYVEGPQICTQAKVMNPQLIRGSDFVAVQQNYTFKIAPPQHRVGSLWTQTLVFPQGKRYFLSSQRIDSVNSSPALFFRIDMPGHVKHNRGDTFSEMYLSYLDLTNTPELGKQNRVPSSVFFEDFAPDDKLNYNRERAGSLPKRFIRAYKLRDPQTGQAGPWLAGMTLDPAAVYEAWTHQRGYVCMIEEFGGRPIRAGESFSAAFLVGYFDSIEEMHQVYDQYAGHNRLEVSPAGWRLLP